MWLLLDEKSLDPGVLHVMRLGNPNCFQDLQLSEARCTLYKDHAADLAKNFPWTMRGQEIFETLLKISSVPVKPSAWWS